MCLITPSHSITIVRFFSLHPPLLEFPSVDFGEGSKLVKMLTNKGCSTVEPSLDPIMVE